LKEDVVAYQPTQTRIIDPYSDYGSNTTNQLSRIASRGTNCIHGPVSLAVTQIDSTSVSISTGFCFKDDVLIQSTSTVTLNFFDTNSYIFPGLGQIQAGSYYVVLQYTIQKSNPLL
jgi:hypothetical protein